MEKPVIARFVRGGVAAVIDSANVAHGRCSVTRKIAHRWLLAQRTLRTLAFLLVFFLLALHPVRAEEDGPTLLGDWPSPQYDAGRTSYNTAETYFRPPFSLYQTTSIGDPGIGLFNMIVYRGHVYISARLNTSGSHSIFAHDSSTLQERWRYSTGDASVHINSPIYADSGLIVFVQADVSRFDALELVALDVSTGAVRWQKQLAQNAIERPPLVNQGVLYVIGRVPSDSNLYLSAHGLSNGEEIWQQKLEGSFSPPLAMADGKLYYWTPEGGLTVRRAAGGQEVWRVNGEDTPFADIGLPTDLVAFPRVLLAATPARIAALNPENGTLHWQRDLTPTGCIVTGGAAHMVSDGVLVAVRNCEDQIVVLDVNDGQERWRTDATPAIPRMVGANGVLYTWSSDDLYAYRLTEGNQLQQQDSDFDQGFAIALANRYLYVLHRPLPSLGYTIDMYERTPVDLAVELVEENSFLCTARVGDELHYRFTVVNNGPVAAEAAELSLSAGPGAVSATATQGSCQGTSPLICDLGHLAVDQRVDVQVTIQAGSPGPIGLSAHTGNDVRDPEPGNDTVQHQEQVAAQFPDLDLTVEELDVIQAVQSHEDDVPLIAGKTTYARAFPAASTDATVAGVTAVLHGSLDGVPLDGSPLQPREPCLDLSAATSGDLDRAFDFYLPAGWRESGVTLRADVNPGGRIDETDADNNAREQTTQYTSLPPICIRTYPVRTTGDCGGDCVPSSVLVGGLGGTGSEFQMVERALSLLPTPEIRIYAEDGIIEEYEFPLGYGPYELDQDDGSLVLDKLQWHDLFSDDPDSCDEENARTLYMGVVDARANWEYGGLARTNQDQLMVLADTEVHENSHNAPYGGRTLAHEIGHNYGRRHVDCGDPVRTDSSYPYDPCRYSDGTDYGFDTFAYNDPPVIPRVILPGKVGDLMSYAKSTWISDYTWRHIAFELNCQQVDLCIWPLFPEAAGRIRSTSAAEPMLAADELLVVSGLVAPDGEAEFTQIFQLPQGVMPQDKTLSLWQNQQDQTSQDDPAYQLELLDAAGELLASQPFTPTETLDGSGNRQSFFVLMPYHAGTAAIQVTRNDQVLTTEAVSAHAPTVTALAPADGEQVETTLMARWQGEDADGDALRYTVQYSHDQGETWRVLVTDIISTEVTFDAALLPGSQGHSLLRVIANDGANTGSSLSAPFTVAPRSPLAMISQPQENAVFDGATSIIVRGRAYDPEDGYLPDGALRWRLNGEAVSGTGGEILLQDLQPGEYELTLTAEDQDGQTGTATKHFTMAGQKPGEPAPSAAGALFLPIVSPGLGR